MWKGVRKLNEASGYAVSLRNDYYSPLSTTADLKSTMKRWNRPSALKGVDYDIEKMKARLSLGLGKYLNEFMALPSYAELQNIGYGIGFTHLDAFTLYMTIRQLKPKRYIEVAAGLSTYYCSLAAEKNASEGYPLAMTCIEPYPYDKLYEIPGIKIIAKQVQDIDLSLFQQLEDNDVFFIDSSHMAKIDSDVPFLYLEVLPTIKVGVVVHIHDVNFPYNIPYPPTQWIFNQIWPMLWNEAMFVQAFLCFNTRFIIEMSTPLIRYFDEPFLKSNIPFYETVEQNPNGFCSIWLKRIS